MSWHGYLEVLGAILTLIPTCCWFCPHFLSLNIPSSMPTMPIRTNWLFWIRLYRSMFFFSYPWHLNIRFFNGDKKYQWTIFDG